jgi:formylglycine-generating enzyme required for sulfatase activity
MRATLRGSLAGLMLAACVVAAGPADAAPAGVRFSRGWPVAPPPGMVVVPAGRFVMGSTTGLGDESPPHAVTLPSYYMDAREVTNASYLAFMQATGHRAPAPVEECGDTSDWQGGKLLAGHGRLPVAFVDWSDATAYARWAGKRLPGEAEWEKAARGSDARNFPWGRDWDPARCNFMTDGPTEVGSFARGASPHGCLDMAGNVWEWTASLYAAYPGNRQKRNDQLGYGYRSVRGGSWDDHCSYGARCYARSSGDPANRLPALGFRCALSVPEVRHFEGLWLPTGTDKARGRAVVEALARALPKWAGPGGAARASFSGGAYTVRLPLKSGGQEAVRVRVRRTACGVWVAARS